MIDISVSVSEWMIFIANVSVIGILVILYIGAPLDSSSLSMSESSESHCLRISVVYVPVSLNQLQFTVGISSSLIMTKRILRRPLP